MQTMVTNDPDEFTRVSGEGRLMMVRFTMPGSTKTIILGMRVPRKQLSRALCELRKRRPDAESIEVALAINSVKLLLLERGVEPAAVITGQWHAHRTTLEELHRSQKRLSERPLDSEDRWIMRVIGSV